MDKKNSKLLFAAIITIFSVFNSYAHTESSNQTTDKHQLTVSKIAENVFQHVSYKEVKGFGLVPASGLVVINDKDAHIIDTPWTNTDTEQLVTWINSQGFTLKSSISTHFHDDRAGGISYLNKLSIDTYASEFTNKLLASRNKAVAKHSLSLPPLKRSN